MTFLNLIKYQIYLLQLENYNLSRYFTVAQARLGRASDTRKDIVWTPKLQLVVTLAAVLAATFDLIITWAIGGPAAVQVVVFLVLGYALGYFFFAFLSAACFIWLPADVYLKRQLILRAAAKRAQFPNLKVIAIAGSYGKTTMKEMVAAVLSQKYRVLKTSENINTPLGISRMILDKLNAETDFMIVEVGEYVRGDVAEICSLVKPSIGIITGINQAHLERMGSMQNTIAAIFELADHLSGGLLVLNGDDNLVRNNYTAHQNGNSVVLYGLAGAGDLAVQKLNYGERGIIFELSRAGASLGEFQTALLADYAAGVGMAVFLLGEHFGLTPDQIRTGIASLKPVAHRLEIVPNSNNVTVIDDSYNGNPAGVSQAIKVLARYADRRKIYITPGLVEMGADSAVIHYNIGKELAAVANLVLLIKNSVTADIQRGLLEHGFAPANIKIYDSAQQAHGDLGNVVKAGDVVMFQNDWPENYL